MTTSEHVEAFVRAVRSGDFDAADARLPLPPARDDALRLALADLHTHRHRWAEAAAVLGEVRRADDPVRLRRHLCANMAALLEHRPAVYRLMIETLERAPGVYAPLPMTDGFTVGRVEKGGRVVPLATNVAAAVAQATMQLKPLTDAGKPIAFCSIGDGHVIGAIVSRPPTLALGRQQAIYLIEPDLSLLLACLLAHDWSGPLGPIAQPRVQWYVGADWADAMRADFAANPCQLFPTTNVRQGGSAVEIEKTLVSVLNDLTARDAVAAADVEYYYATRAPAEFAAALRGEAGRPARVMLITTRFSTVLQYSTRDAADAFRQLGMDAHVLIEPVPHHGITRTAMRRTLAQFKPDLVFQIDHHRFEHDDLFPAGLPFVNWIQDLLPHLMKQEAGRKLGPADFVLTPSLQRWVDDFAYPARQCMEFRKLTRVPERPKAWASDSRRVIYVSNWSYTAEAARDELLAGAGGSVRDLIAAACARMTDVYANGGALPTPGDVRRVVLSLIDGPADEALVRQVTTRLFDRLNNLLFRQQGLAWAAEACKTLGMTLDIYGNGWDRNPRFADFARGTVDYGIGLETLTRDAGVTLILEPFMALAHQRPLDAIAAGGFCLVRDHPTNHTTAEWIDLLGLTGDAAADGPTLKAHLRGQNVKRYLANVAACDSFDASPQRVDHAATVRRMQGSGFLPANGAMLPMLDQVTFASAETLRYRLSQAMLNPRRCAEIARQQRQCVEAGYSYRGGMERVVEFVAKRMADTPAARRAA